MLIISLCLGWQGSHQYNVAQHIQCCGFNFSAANKINTKIKSKITLHYLHCGNLYYYTHTGCFHLLHGNVTHLLSVTNGFLTNKIIYYASVDFNGKFTHEKIRLPWHKCM